MKALVIGGARSGTGVSLLLNKHNYQVTLVSKSDFEERELLETSGIEVILDDSNTDKFDDYDLIVKNPGIPNEHPLVSRFKTVYNEIEIAKKFNPKGKYYSVSGTNGKTTTVFLLNLMLKKKDENAILAGNVGVSLSQIIYDIGDHTNDVALELSSFQIEGLVNFEAEVFSLMNFSPDHLDRYDSVEDYYKSKLNIIPKAKTFIRNIDDIKVLALTDNLNANTLDLSVNQKSDICVIDNQAYFKDVKLFKLGDLKIKGKHNLYNALFASSMAYLAGVSLDDIQAVLKTFTGFEHRFEYVATIDDITYYNDSKATNPESTVVAIDSFEKDLILLAGGYDKQISFDVLKSYTDKVKLAILYGDSKEKLKEVFTDAYLVNDLEEAFNIAQNFAKKGDTILLSPASASFDQFKNFEERGNFFKDLVYKLKNDKGV